MFSKCNTQSIFKFEKDSKYFFQDNFFLYPKTVSGYRGDYEPNVRNS